MPGAKPVHLKAKAKQDLSSIWRYTWGQFGEAQADAYYFGFLQCFHQLAGGDLQGRPHRGKKLYHKIRVGRHFVFYEDQHTKYEVKRILHERMNFDQHL